MANLGTDERGHTQDEMAFLEKSITGSKIGNPEVAAHHRRLTRCLLERAATAFG
jgi:hypothetical protein